MKLLILDFDQTIADTTFLASLRAQNDWDGLISRAGEIKIFKGIDRLIAEAKKLGLKIAVVTSLPAHVVKALCKALKFNPEFTIGHGDYKYSKPSSYPMKAALDAANVKSYEAIAIGDRCVDAMSARAAGIYNTIGAEWGCPDETAKRELFLARPAISAPTVEIATELIKKIVSQEVRYSKKAPISVHNDKQYNKALWTAEDPTTRGNLDSGLEYQFARIHYKGGWNACVANSLIKNFKAGPGQAEYISNSRDVEIQHFADELKLGLPKGADIAFIPTSKRNDDPSFDDRFVQVGTILKEQGFIVHEPIKVKTSHESVHSQETGESREPEAIMANWKFSRFTGKAPSKLYVIDDVMTSGGHFSAFARLIRMHEENIEIEGRFWTAHLSIPHPSSFNPENIEKPEKKGLFW